MLAAGFSGALLAMLHGFLCSLPKVSDIATGIALMLLGVGLAFYFGKSLIQPQAVQIPSIELGAWSDSAQVQSALRINALFPIGVVLAVLMAWMLKHTRWGLILRMAGDSTDAGTSLGLLGEHCARLSNHGRRVHCRHWRWHRCRCTTQVAGTKACRVDRG